MVSTQRANRFGHPVSYTLYPEAAPVLLADPGSPVAARAGFYTNPDHKIRFAGGPRNADEVGERLLYSGGKDYYHGTAGLGIVPLPGFQLDFAGNYAKDVLEFSVSTVFRF